MRQIPYTMMKFACFEKTVELLYAYVDWNYSYSRNDILNYLVYRNVVPKPREQCTKGEQLVVTFAAGYIAGIFCAIVSHPADTVVSKMNQIKGASAMDTAKALGFSGLWKGLTPRIVMIGKYLKIYYHFTAEKQDLIHMIFIMSYLFWHLFINVI